MTHLKPLVFAVLIVFVGPVVAQLNPQASGTMYIHEKSGKVTPFNLRDVNGVLFERAKQGSHDPTFFSVSLKNGQSKRFVIQSTERIRFQNEKPPATPVKGVGSLEGTWTEVVFDKDISNSRLTFKKINDTWQVVGSFTYKGTPLTYRGTAHFQNKMVKFSTVFDRLYPGWDKRANGEQEYKLSSDGKTLAGTYKNGYGSTGPKKFIKR